MKFRTLSSCGLSTFFSGSKSWKSAATYRCSMSLCVMSTASCSMASRVMYVTSSSCLMLWYP